MLNHFIVYIITLNREVFRVCIEFSIFLTTDCPMIVLRPVCPRNVLRENSWIYFQVADIVSATMKNTKNCFRNFIINHCEIHQQPCKKMFLRLFIQFLQNIIQELHKYQCRTTYKSKYEQLLAQKSHWIVKTWLINC